MSGTQFAGLSGESTPLVKPGNYSPVTVYMEDSIGAVFLGILAGILLIGWLHAEARNRDLIKQLETTHGNHPPSGTMPAMVR